MPRGGLFILNSALGVLLVGAHAFAAAYSTYEKELDAVKGAFLATWWAGLLTGATVGFGATVGPRPALPILGCLKAHLWILLTSIAGAFIGSLFATELHKAQEAIRGYLAHAGIVIGSGVGAVAATVWNVIQIYRQRGRAR